MSRRIFSSLAMLLLLSLPAFAVDPSAVDVPGLPTLTHFQVQDYAEDYQPAGHCDRRVAALVKGIGH